jgi:hypothetical protein
LCISDAWKRTWVNGFVPRPIKTGEMHIGKGGEGVPHPECEGVSIGSAAMEGGAAEAVNRKQDDEQMEQG